MRLLTPSAVAISSMLTPLSFSSRAPARFCLSASYRSPGIDATRPLLPQYLPSDVLECSRAQSQPTRAITRRLCGRSDRSVGLLSYNYNLQPFLSPVQPGRLRHHAGCDSNASAVRRGRKHTKAHRCLARHTPAKSARQAVVLLENVAQPPLVLFVNLHGARK